jgi:hypothetical protein
MSVDRVAGWRGQPKIEWRTFIEMPDLVRLHSVPAAHGVARQEKVDRGECRTGSAPICRKDNHMGAVELAVISSFRMRQQA